eukprot:COSAG06_NODE_538_length_14479_cov_3.477608_2_plen_419_part_00
MRVTSDRTRPPRVDLHPMMLLDLAGLLLLFAAPRLAGAAVVGLTADLEMWQQDGEYLNITATAAALVRGSALSLRYSVAADITLVYETTKYNGSLSTTTLPRPYYQAIMDNVDEVLLMDYGQTTHGGLCPGGLAARCPLAKPLWWIAPWIAYAESLRRISDSRRQVLVTMGLPVDAGPMGTARDWFGSEEQLESFIGEAADWAASSGFTPSGDAANATGWQHGPFHKTAVFMASLYKNLTDTRPCAPPVCLPGKQRPPRGLWTYQSTVDPMVYGSDATAASARFLAWCVEHGIDELYLYPARIRGCTSTQHGLSLSGSNATTERQLAAFVRSAGTHGVDVQLFVGVRCTARTLSYTHAHRRPRLAASLRICGHVHAANLSPTTCTQANKYWAPRVTTCVVASLDFVRREGLARELRVR